MKSNRLLIGVMIVIASVLVGCATDPAQKGAGAAAQASSGTKDVSTAASPYENPNPSLSDSGYRYRINPEDLLEIKVFQAKDLERDVRVDSSGNITLPLVGAIHAAGLTNAELEQTIAAKLAEKYMQNPQVNVLIKDFASQRVTVEGAVVKPGVFEMKGQTTLLEAIAQASGPEPFADRSDVTIYRHAHAGQGGKLEVLRFDLDEIRGGKQADPVLRGKDVIVVARSEVRYHIDYVLRSIKGLMFIPI